MIFLFPRWDMLIPWRVLYIRILFSNNQDSMERGFFKKWLHCCCLVHSLQTAQTVEKRVVFYVLKYIQYTFLSIKIRFLENAPFKLFSKEGSLYRKGCLWKGCHIIKHHWFKRKKFPIGRKAFQQRSPTFISYILWRQLVICSIPENSKRKNCSRWWRWTSLCFFCWSDAVSGLGDVEMFHSLRQTMIGTRRSIHVCVALRSRRGQIIALLRPKPRPKNPKR